MTQNISFADFENGELNSLSWYDLLPGDPVRVILEEETGSAADIADEILLDKSEIDCGKLDLLAATLLNQCPSVTEYRRWPELAYRLSQVMSQNLTASGSRSVRMHAQRLVYYLQSIIDAGNSTEGLKYIVTEKPLDAQKPWDYLKLNGNEWWISSEENNLHCLEVTGKKLCWKAGMPTQLDLLPDGVLSVGSIYSEGAILINGSDWEHINHHCPIVLVFEFHGERYFLDHNAELWKYAQNMKVLDAICPQAHFARYFDGVVYVMDNGDFGHITIIKMESLDISRQAILPVQVCNDLAVVDDSKYLIDKQQGSVFKFDKDWQFETRVLNFGRGRGDLLDPVSIRCQNGKLYVVSWLTGRLSELHLF